MQSNSTNPYPTHPPPSSSSSYPSQTSAPHMQNGTPGHIHAPPQVNRTSTANPHSQNGSQSIISRPPTMNPSSSSQQPMYNAAQSSSSRQSLSSNGTTPYSSTSSSNAPNSSPSRQRPNSSSPSPSSPSAPPMIPFPLSPNEQQLQDYVLSYLQKRGFYETANMLRSEMTPKPKAFEAGAGSTDIHNYAIDMAMDVHTHILKQISLYGGVGVNGKVMNSNSNNNNNEALVSKENSPSIYDEQYRHLKTWITSCIDIYKLELGQILWPIYVHFFVALINKGFPDDAARFLQRHRADFDQRYQHEINSFAFVMTEVQAQQNEVIRLLTQRKTDISLSALSFQLLLSFLYEKGLFLTCKVINEHIAIRIAAGKPWAIETDHSALYRNPIITGEPGSGVAGYKKTPYQGLGGTLTGPLANSAKQASEQAAQLAVQPLKSLELNGKEVRWGVLPYVNKIHEEILSHIKDKLTQMLRKEKEKRKAEKEEEERKKAASNQDGEDGEEEGKRKRRRLPDASSSQTDGGDAALTVAAPPMPIAEKKGPGGRPKGSSSSSSHSSSSSSAGAVPSTGKIKETLDEKEEISRIASSYVKIFKQMEMTPIQKELQETLPKVRDDQKEKYRTDLHFRAKLSSSNLPSICLYTFLNSMGAVNRITLSNEGNLVAAACEDSLVKVWDINQSSSKKAVISTSDGGIPLHQRILKEKQWLNLSETDRDLKLKEEEEEEEKNQQRGEEEEDDVELPYTKLVGHSGPVYSTSFSSNGNWLLSSSEDATVRLWNLQTGRNLVSYKGHNAPVWDVAFSPLGFYFATGSNDSTARLWSTDKAFPLRLFVGHTSDVECVKFHPNCNYVCTGSSDGTCRLWDIQTGECVRIFIPTPSNSIHTSHKVTGTNVAVTSLAMDPEGRYCAAGGVDGSISVFDLSSGRLVNSLFSHTNSIQSLDFSQEGELLASGSTDGTVKLWDFKKQNLKFSAVNHNSTSLNVPPAVPIPVSTNVPIASYPTKSTSISFVKFTPRNLLLSAGLFRN